MKLIIHPVIDGERERFKLSTSKKIIDGQVRLHKLFEMWLVERVTHQRCLCCVKHLEVLPAKSTHSIEVYCGWWCERCVQLLKARMQELFPEVTRLEIGSRLSSIKPPKVDYLIVGPKKVTFENGSVVEVARFAIRRTCITVGEFEAFVKATGLVTQAEKDDGKTFRNNEAMYGISQASRKHNHASCLTFDEAVAYCKWAGGRLPTEAEWIAAALVDDRVLKMHEYESYMHSSGPQVFKGEMIRVGPEWVDGLATAEDFEQQNIRRGPWLTFTGEKLPTGSQLAVVRSGPHWVREEGWQNSHFRNVVPTNAYDLLTCFRMVQAVESIGIS